MKETTIVWFRGKDLRLSDSLPLQHAVAHGQVLPLFIVDPDSISRPLAQARPHHFQFLLDSLQALSQALKQRGSCLLVVAGKARDVIPHVLSEWNANQVVAQREATPQGRERDRSLAGIVGSKFQLFGGETLMAPGTLRTVQNKPYSVFTPFARNLVETVKLGRPLPAPKTMPTVPGSIQRASTRLPSCAQLGIARNELIQAGGELEARARLRRFVRLCAETYAEHRDRMDLPGTSRLSADLKFGTISARQVWTSIRRAYGDAHSGRSFLNELAWREFAYSTLWDRPQLVREPFRAEFAKFPWQNDERDFQAWTRGRTGYPLVDAAARQLLQEGFVHNRARMVAASFLTKHLLVDYRKGEGHYMRHLTDGDPPQNNAGWQWSAGCGCDAQPYFRIFNPIAQGKKFDPNGDYVRRWVPELSGMPAKYIHQPSTATETELARARVRLDETYPRPIVDHRFARERFLALAKAHLSRTA